MHCIADLLAQHLLALLVTVCQTYTAVRRTGRKDARDVNTFYRTETSGNQFGNGLREPPGSTIDMHFVRRLIILSAVKVRLIP